LLEAKLGTFEPCFLLMKLYLNTRFGSVITDV